MKAIPIVFATDENYVPYCGVAVSSLIMNASSEKQYEVAILYDKLSFQSIYRLEQLSTEHVYVRCVCVHEQVKEMKVQEYSHLTIASAYRLVIPEIFKDYDKAIYLDSDIVVEADVAKLYGIDIGDNFLGAVHGYFKEPNSDFLYKHITETLKIDESHFFNAGILVMNLKAFRENQVTEKCLSLLAERNDLCFMDQCALNIVCEGKVEFLPKRWNYEWLFLLPLTDPSFCGEISESEFCKDPAIVHYDGMHKPWDYPEWILADRFWFYARQTIFYEEILCTAQLQCAGELIKLFGAANKCRDIAVYGAGNAGRRYVSKILSLKLCRIVVWVDQNYAEKQEYQLPVENVELLYQSQFNRVLIAIEDRSVSNEVKEMLLKRGIDEEKIIQIG